MDGTTQNEAAAPPGDPGSAAGPPSGAALSGAPPSGGVVEAVGPDGIGRTVDILQIMAAIPHRYPFLMIDRMVEVVNGASAIGIKNVSINEPFFQGHFPAKPVMPGVLIIEAMAQTAAALVVLTLGDDFDGKLVYFMTIDSAKFRRPVGPGDQLRVHVTKERQRGNVYKFRGIARVDGVSVAEATYSAMIMG